MKNVFGPRTTLSKALGVIVVGLTLALLFTSCRATYLVRQSAGQIRLLANARPVTELVSSDTIHSDLRKRLILIEEVLEFARLEGLRVGTAYQSYVDLRGRAPVYVLTACRPDSLDLKRWRFPIVGEFPYRGFFSEAEARQAAERLKRLGYEVYVGAARAYSTLGWFRDPLISSFVERPLGECVDTILHELVHRTLFVPDDLRFNESLASFVAEKLTVKFLETRRLSRELGDYRQLKRDENRVSLEAQRTLRELRRAFAEAETAEDRLVIKAERLAALHEKIGSEPLESDLYSEWYRKVRWNLPLLLNFDLYTGDTRTLEATWVLASGITSEFLARVEAGQSR